MYVCVRGKKLDKNPIKHEISRYMEQELDYYSRNRQARKEYQRQYYENNKERIQQRRKLDEIADPERFEARKNYNKSYYEKNKEKILKRRAEAYAAKKLLKKNAQG